MRNLIKSIDLRKKDSRAFVYVIIFGTARKMNGNVDTIFVALSVDAVSLMFKVSCVFDNDTSSISVSNFKTSKCSYNVYFRNNICYMHRITMRLGRYK